MVKQKQSYDMVNSRHKQLYQEGPCPKTKPFKVNTQLFRWTGHSSTEQQGFTSIKTRLPAWRCVLNWWHFCPKSAFKSRVLIKTVTTMKSGCEMADKHISFHPIIYMWCRKEPFVYSSSFYTSVFCFQLYLHPSPAVLTISHYQSCPTLVLKTYSVHLKAFISTKQETQGMLGFWTTVTEQKSYSRKRTQWKNKNNVWTKKEMWE